MKNLIACLAMLATIGCGGDDGGDGLPDGDNVGGVISSEDGPLAGATVSVVGGSASATTGADGTFSLQAPDGDVDFLVEASGYWGQIIRGTVLPDESISGVEIDLASDADVAEIATALSRTLDESKGIVALEFYSSDADLAGTSASVREDNVEVPSDPPFTFDGNDDPVESPTILGGTMEQELIFSNVAVGDYEIFGDVSGSVGCQAEFDTLTKPFPVRAKAISSMTLYCGSGE